MPSQEQAAAGRHRWGGERSALYVLAAMVGLIVLAGVSLWLFGGDDEPGDPGLAADDGTEQVSPPVKDESTSQRSSPKDAKTTDEAQKYTPGKNPHTAAEACGGGFAPIDELTITASGTTLGTVQLLYDSGSGANCVVTLKAVDIGARTSMTASLTVKGGKRSSDSGKFDYYAGPVTGSAAGACVKWGGAIDGHRADSGDWSHCG